VSAERSDSPAISSPMPMASDISRNPASGCGSRKSRSRFPCRIATEPDLLDA
jgi:hypothetical protein